MDHTHWRNPSFGGSPHGRRPRYPGRGGGNFGSPRQFSPHHRTPSPYHYQSQQGMGSPFRPHHHRTPYYDREFTSTPVHHSGRPYFRGGGGRHKRPSFGSPVGMGASDDIENWISPEMWDDPWRKFTTPVTDSINEGSTSRMSESKSDTKFAESDFDVTDNLVSGTNTKFSESDFNATDSVPSNIESKVDMPEHCDTVNIEAVRPETSDQQEPCHERLDT